MQKAPQSTPAPREEEFKRAERISATFGIMNFMHDAIMGQENQRTVKVGKMRCEIEDPPQVKTEDLSAVFSFDHLIFDITQRYSEIKRNPGQAAELVQSEFAASCENLPKQVEKMMSSPHILMRRAAASLNDDLQHYSWQEDPESFTSRLFQYGTPKVTNVDHRNAYHFYFDDDLQRRTSFYDMAPGYFLAHVELPFFQHDPMVGVLKYEVEGDTYVVVDGSPEQFMFLQVEFGMGGSPISDPRLVEQSLRMQRTWRISHMNHYMYTAVSETCGIEFNQIPFPAQMHIPAALLHITEANQGLWENALIAMQNSDDWWESLMFASDSPQAFEDLCHIACDNPQAINMIAQFSKQFADINDLIEHDDEISHDQGYALFTFRHHVQRIINESIQAGNMSALHKAHIALAFLHDRLHRTPHEEKPELLITKLDLANIVSTIDDITSWQDLNEYQEFIEKARQSNAQLKRSLVAVLLAQDKLKPKPELMWVVDRPMEEYSRRAGIDFDSNFGLLWSHADIYREKEEKPVLLELGGGNGAARSSTSRSQYIDFTVSDSLYYDVRRALSPLLKQYWYNDQILDHADDIVDTLAALIYLTPESCQNGTVEYDEEAMERITANPNTIRDILKEKAQYLRGVDQVVESQGTQEANGSTTTYSFRTISNDAQQFLTAMADNPEGFMDSSIDLIDTLPVSPKGMIVGDFTELEKLPDESIDIMIAMRSTVYLQDKAWFEYIVTAAHKTKPEGMLFDDSIRENFGTSYRIDQARDINHHLPHEKQLYVVLGPKQDGEDRESTQDLVPTQCVCCTPEKAKNFVAGFIQEGYQMLHINDRGLDGYL